jgi:hypothetical protein
VEPDAETVFDEPLSRVPSVDFQEIERLSRFLPVIVAQEYGGEIVRAKALVLTRTSESSEKPWSSSRAPAQTACSRSVT